MVAAGLGNFAKSYAARTTRGASNSKAAGGETGSQEERASSQEVGSIALKGQPIQPPSFGEFAPPAYGEIELIGLPAERGLNGAQGVAVKTISDGRTVVRLSDGRELAFKAENIRTISHVVETPEDELPRSEAEQTSGLSSLHYCRFDPDLVSKTELDHLGRINAAALHLGRINAAALRVHQAEADQSVAQARQLLDLACSGEPQSLDMLGLLTKKEADCVLQRFVADLGLLARELDDLDLLPELAHAALGGGCSLTPTPRNLRASLLRAPTPRKTTLDQPLPRGYNEFSKEDLAVLDEYNAAATSPLPAQGMSANTSATPVSPDSASALAVATPPRVRGRGSTPRGKSGSTLADRTKPIRPSSTTGGFRATAVVHAEARRSTRVSAPPGGASSIILG